MFVGTSTLNGLNKMRFANDIGRVKILAKNGHEDILMVELPQPMTKVEAARFIESIEEFGGVVEQTTIADYLERNGGSVMPEDIEMSNAAAELEREQEAEAFMAESEEWDIEVDGIPFD